MRRPLLLILALAACADPRAACLSRATAELATLDTLIAETRANLDRGYAIARQPSLSPGVQLCTRTGVAEICAGREAGAEERPVAIDGAAERAKLATLLERRRIAALGADREVAACEASFPQR